MGLLRSKTRRRSSIIKIQPPENVELMLNRFDIAIKDKIFTNRVWKKFLIKNKMQQKFIFDDKIELHKLY